MSLYQQITRFETLTQGWARVNANGGMEGVDHQTLYMFNLDRDANLRQLKQELDTHTYQAQPLLRLEIPKPGSKKKRVLLIPTVRDRVVQAAAMIVLQPLVEKELENCTFAYRPKRSYLHAIEAVRQLYEEGFQWVVDADITAFFDNVNHELLFKRFRQLVPDPAVEAMVRQWITADMIHDYRRVSRNKGIPQGAVVSPMLANLFLDRFDETLTKKGFRLIRYADDFVILCRSKPKAEAALKLTESLLENLELQLHPEKTRLVSFEDGFRFLGSLFIRGLVIPTKQHGSTNIVEGETSPTPLPDSSAVKPQSIQLPDRRIMEETALGRAFVQALDAEGLNPAEFLAQLSNSGELAKSSLSEESESPGPETQVFQRPGTSTFLRTLYVHEQGAWLKLNGGRFVVTSGRDKKKILLSVPVDKVQQVMIFGQGFITPATMRHCLLHDITISLHSSRGQYYGKIDDSLAVDVSRERRQFLYSMDAQFSFDLAQRFVSGKVHNQRRLIRRYNKRRPSTRLQQAARKLARTSRQIRAAESIDQLRGLEGGASAILFRVLPVMIKNSPFDFKTRTRRPPRDPINAMLSFGYTLLFNNVYSMVRLHRLNPFVGFLHVENRGHPALVSDMVEEFRFLIDRMVILIANKQLLSPDDFEYPETGFEEPAGCFLTDSGRKAFLHAFEQVMHRKVRHEVSGRRVNYRQCIDLQVRMLADHLMGHEAYQPFMLA